MKPDRRVESLRNFARRMNSAPAVTRELEKWGMALEDGPKQFNGRYLPPEDVYLKKTVKYQLNNADWTNRESYIICTLVRK